MADAPETREREPEGGEAADGSRLDCDTNNSPEEIIFVPSRSGGRLHPVTGAGMRNQDIQKLCVIADAMERPHLLTLTADRSNWESPQAVLDEICKQFSRLVSERLHSGLWFRVYELQTKTGDGWPHVHALIDVKGRIHSLRDTCWKFWRDKWGIGGVDLVKARSAKGAAKYIAKYLAKGHYAYPSWFLERSRAPRMVGYSKAASAVLQRAGLSIKQDPPLGDEPKRKRRATTTVCERLALSAKSVAVVRRVGKRAEFLGTLMVDPNTLIGVHESLPNCWVERDEFDRTVVRTRGWTRGTISYVNNWLRAKGYTDSLVDSIQRAEKNWRYSWDYMQAMEGGRGEA